MAQGLNIPSLEMAAKIPSRASAPVLMSGQTVDRIDRYQLVERIGRGGMAEVFRAKMQSIGGFERHVAVKVLLPNFASEPEFVEMLLDEARIAGGIDHPNVLQVIDVGRQAEIFYLVMEFIDGKDLRGIALKIPGGRLPLGMSLYVISEMLRGLHAVHTAVDENGNRRNIVHRDISPANVLVDRRGFVKLGDFGIAHASGRITRTRVGAIKGKSRYMAPEQLAGQQIDHRADLYAVGVTLFEAIFGEFARASSRPSIFGPMFTWPEALPEGLPADVEAILRRLVVENRDHRYRDAAELRVDLELALHRIAPGYGPDTLARELVHLGVERARAVSDPAGASPFGDSTERVGPSPFTPVGVKMGRWQQSVTAENVIAARRPPPVPSVRAPAVAIPSREVRAIGSQQGSPSQRFRTRPQSLNGFAYAEVEGSRSREATVLPTDLRSIPRIASMSASTRRNLRLGMFGSAFAAITIGVAALVANSGSGPPVPSLEPPSLVSAGVAPRTVQLPVDPAAPRAREAQLTAIDPTADDILVTPWKDGKRRP